MLAYLVDGCQHNNVQYQKCYVRFTLEQVNHSLWHIKSMTSAHNNDYPCDIRILEFDDVLKPDCLEMGAGAVLKLKISC